MPIAAITNGKFANAESIVQTLSQELGCKVIRDQEIVEETARIYDIRPAVLHKVIDTKPLAFNELTHTREKCIAYLRKTIVDHVSGGNCIFYGLLGHLIPYQTSHVMKILIIADKIERTKTGMAKDGLSEGEVAKLISISDKRAILWTNALFGKKAWDKSLYDIVIPSDKTEAMKTTQLILEHFEEASVIPESVIAQEVSDLALTSEIELALSRISDGLSISTTNGDVLITINKRVLMMSKFKQKITALAEGVEGVKTVKTKEGGKAQSRITRNYDFETPTRILLVDDEKEFVQTLSERLKTRHIENEFVLSGEEALNFADQGDSDVMVLDLKMPGIDGFEVLKKVKQSKPNTEVIILTGHGSEKDRKTCLELGAFAYLQKPADIDLLATTMQEAYQKISDAKHQLSD
jgi:two-component system, OmpR family, response regulator CpxR